MEQIMKLVMVAILVFGAWDVEATVRVVTTTPDLAAIVRDIGGDFVVVKSIARGNQDPHYVQAKPSFMRTMNQADLLIYTGLELEVGWLPLLIQGARNPKIRPGALGHLDASVGIKRLEIPDGKLDRSMGDVHPEGNPHYMLDPRNGLIVGQTIADKLSQIDPENAEGYQKNLALFQKKLQAKIEMWEARLRGLQGKQIVTYHKLWEYLTDWLHLKIVSQVENKPGIPPSPRHVAELVVRMKANDIILLLSSDYSAPKPAERVAQQAGAKLIVLPASVGGREGIETYADLFEVIVSQLASGL